MKTAELYARAGELAVIAMGRETIRYARGGRHTETVLRAEEDPLAWWVLTDSIVQLARAAAKPSPPEKKP